jgi:hypothetical protein
MSGEKTLAFVFPTLILLYYIQIEMVDYQKKKEIAQNVHVSEVIGAGSDVVVGGRGGGEG